MMNMKELNAKEIKVVSGGSIIGGAFAGPIGMIIASALAVAGTHAGNAFLETKSGSKLAKFLSRDVRDIIGGKKKPSYWKFRQSLSRRRVVPWLTPAKLPAQNRNSPASQQNLPRLYRGLYAGCRSTAARHIRRRRINVERRCRFWFRCRCRQ